MKELKDIIERIRVLAQSLDVFSKGITYNHMRIGPLSQKTQQVCEEMRRIATLSEEIDNLSNKARLDTHTAFDRVQEVSGQIRNFETVCKTSVSNTKAAKTENTADPCLWLKGFAGNPTEEDIVIIMRSVLKYYYPILDVDDVYLLASSPGSVAFVVTEPSMEQFYMTVIEIAFEH